LEDVEAFVKRFAAYGLTKSAICIGYGMSEHVAGVTWTLIGTAPAVDWVSEQGLAGGNATPVEPHSAGSRAIMSCGATLPTIQLRIVDAEGKELPDRSVGEPIVQSSILFQSYYRQPEETAQVMQGGWFHSGDLGYLSGGELFICGRKKDLIIIAGRNIHPLQLEKIAESVMGAAGRFAAAFGVTNASLGTEIAVLVCEMRQLPDEPEQERLRRQIREQVRRTLEIFVAEILFAGPGWIIRTTSGKIKRGANREKYLAETSLREDHACLVEPRFISPGD
jgi:fatty-acyl-CoA synthase